MAPLIDALRRLEDRSAFADAESEVPVGVIPVAVAPEQELLAREVSATEEQEEQPAAEKPEVNPPVTADPAANRVVPGQLGASETVASEPIANESTAHESTAPPSDVRPSAPEQPTADRRVQSIPERFDSPFKPRGSRESTDRATDELVDREELLAPVSLRAMIEAKASSEESEPAPAVPTSTHEMSAPAPPTAPEIVSMPTEAEAVATTVTEITASLPVDLPVAEMPVANETLAAESPAANETSESDVALASDSAPADSPPQGAHESSQQLEKRPTDEARLMSVCDNLFARLPGADRAILAFASVSENDAHASAIQQLATTMAADLDDPVLVVDGSPDLEFSQMTGVRDASRLDELTIGRLKWQELVVQTTTPGLCVLPLCVGSVTSEASQGVTRLLAEITDRYPCVLIDLGGCPSTLCSSLLDGCDGAVLMVESGFSPVDEAVSALRHLSTFRPPVLGALLVRRREAS